VSADARNPLSWRCSAIRLVGNGTNAMHISRNRLITRNVRSAASINRIQV
jgi:hypothetical protein